jgi:hypothetical protein
VATNKKRTRTKRQSIPQCWAVAPTSRTKKTLSKDSSIKISKSRKTPKLRRAKKKQNSKSTLIVSILMLKMKKRTKN